MKKFLSLILSGILMLSLFSLPCYAADPLYQGYSEMISVKGENPPMHTGIRIKDGTEADGRDHIAYCYDVEKAPPTEENATFNGEDDRCFYTRIDNYLQENDPYINAYGAEKKQKVALALCVGYPFDIYGDYTADYEGKITPDEARYVTQDLVWNITKDHTVIPTPNDSFSQEMCEYYKTLYNSYIKDFVEGTEFFPSSTQMKGDMTAQKVGDEYQIGPLSLHGIMGANFYADLLTSDSDMKIYHFPSGEPITYDDPLISGEEFIIKTPNNPQRSVVGLNWLCGSAKFYFYTHVSGGKNQLGKKAIQNLVRAEPILDEDIIWFSFDEKGTAEKLPDEMIQLSLKKHWDNVVPNEILPSVNVWILADGERLFCCELKEESNWQATVTVPKSHLGENIISYSVEEAPVPSGYTSKVTGDTASGFVVTNTGKPTSPEEPDPILPDIPDGPAKPGIPHQPDTPNQPGTPNQPDTPEQPSTPNQPGTPNQPDTPEQPDDAPKTGDTSHIELWLSLSLIFLYSATVLLLANLKKRRI